MPVVKYEERRADVCACLCISIVTTETSYISVDDCFAAFCLVNRDSLTPPRKNTDSIPKTAAIFHGGFKSSRCAAKKDPQIGRLAHAGHGVFRPKIAPRLPAASDAATGIGLSIYCCSFSCIHSPKIIW